MLKFIRGKGQQPSAERQKLQRELFAFRKTVQHGFPNKPMALAWDPLLRLMAIGTASGAIKVFGRPGVEFYGQHTNGEIAVTQIIFLPGTGRLVSLCDDNSLHLWETASESSLVEVRYQSLEGKLKRISTVCTEASGDHLLLGTEGGNIYLLDLATFTMSDNIIYQDVVMQNCPEDYKLNPGAVECISEHPTKSHLLLIGYNRGLMVVWDRQASRAQNTFVSNQQLESVCWNETGSEFTSSHNDGSYMTWELAINAEKPFREPVTLYGPFPCKAITKLVQRSSVSDENITIFAGGMPRSSYSDKYTVTVVQEEKHVVFYFTSWVIDFFTTTAVPAEVISEDEVDAPRPQSPGLFLPQTVRQPATSLVVLAEEELIVIDLTDPSWNMMRLPYLVSLHASAVTCSHHVSSVDEEVYNNIVDAGKKQTQHLYSDSQWPVSGGQLLCAKPAQPNDTRQLLLTGHEDGTVAFWDASGVTLNPLYKFSTANLFSGEDVLDDGVDSPQSGDDEEEWPPFRKTGVFDPYSDDPRLAVKKIALCPLSGTLIVAGTAGHVVTANIGMDQISKPVKSVTMNIVSDRDGFVWKGHDQLNLRGCDIAMAPGFQVSSVLQLVPPAAVTCCALQAEWGLVAAGTAHGLALYDYRRLAPVLIRCTLNPNDLTGAGDTPISRRKSFKKSLRESFRRLRKGRSQRRQPQSSPSPVVEKKTPPQAAPKKTPESGDSFSPLEAKPIERQIEARPVDDSNGSMVRCLYFARSFLVSVQNTIPTLWAGTNNGTVYVFTITVPPTNRRSDDEVTCNLAKEIQLKHRAPVIGITVLDGASVPLPEPLEVERGVSPLPDATQPHRVIIASEEQFKIFSLPSLKPYCKYKLTAHEGARVRRMAFANFSCMPSEPVSGKGGLHTECCLLCLTNLGDCLVLSVPDLRRQLNAAAVRKEDINGISSLTFSKYGEALYLHSSSELQRITVSANKVTRARCYLTLPMWARLIEAPSSLAADEAPMLNGEHKDVHENGAAEENQHNVTLSSQSIGDITVDSVKDHLIQALNNRSGASSPENLAARLGTINLQSSSVNQSSVIVKTTTLTTLNSNSSTGQPAGTTEANTTTTSHHSNSTTTDNILEHSREEGQITRVETSTVTVPAGTDPKTILEMFERNRTPLTAPLARDDTETETVTITETH